MKSTRTLVASAWAVVLTALAAPGFAQLCDSTTSPNVAGEGIAKSYADEIGAGRGDVMTPGSSAFIIARDPFRAIRRGRQLFQRKFTMSEGLGPRAGDGTGNIGDDKAIGAGLSDSCALCHGRPRGSAGFGGDVATRPDSRDAPHLFGLGLKEMLADEMTSDLRAIRAAAIAEARSKRGTVTKPLVTKGVGFGDIVARPDGTVDSSRVVGVDADLRVKPFFREGSTTSIREFVVGALKNEMGLQAVDQDLARAARGERVTTPSGMVLDGTLDHVDPPSTDDPAADPDGDHVANEVPASVVDYLEFYLLNYFKPALGRQTEETAAGRRIFDRIACTQCHVPDLQIDRDRRVADVETISDPTKGIMNGLFATATPLFTATDDGTGLPALKAPAYRPFLVRNIFTDFKRHDLGPAFHERNYDGSTQTQFITAPLWGVGSTGPYGHDGRSVTLEDVILRHGGEAQASRDAFARLPAARRRALLEFLSSLVLFPPDDTASTLDPGDPTAEGFPQFGHGSVKLSVLFNDPTDRE